MSIPQFCEIAMLCLFGCSWPFNIAKAIRARTAKGKSVVFEVVVITGYLIGLFGLDGEAAITGPREVMEQFNEQLQRVKAGC